MSIDPEGRDPLRRWLPAAALMIGALAAFGLVRTPPPRDPTGAAPAPVTPPAPTHPGPAEPPRAGESTDRRPARRRRAAAPKGRGLPRAYAPRTEEPPKLRAVHGLVLDAHTRQPVPHAWVAWRLPPPVVVDRVLGDPGFRDPAFTMLTDARGRFRVERLPDDQAVSSTLFAVAQGYAYAAARPGLREDVTLLLPPMATLEVVVRGPLRPEPAVTLEGGDERITAGLPAWGDARDRVRFTHLAPGSYSVSLDAAERTRLELRSGERRVVHLERRLLDVAGAVAQVQSESELSLVDVKTFRRVSVRTDRLGGFRAALPPGRYAAFLRVGDSDVRLPGTIRADRRADLQPPAPLAGLPIRLTRDGAPLRSTSLGLVDLERPLTSLVHLTPEEAPGAFVGRAPPGRYGLFEGSVYLGELRWPPAGPRAVETFEVDLTFALPAALRADEVLRCDLTIRPSALDGRPDLVERFAAAGRRRVSLTRASPATRLRVGSPGRYVITAHSDLGRTTEVLRLTGPGQVSLELR